MKSMRKIKRILVSLLSAIVVWVVVFHIWEYLISQSNHVTPADVLGQWVLSFTLAFLGYAYVHDRIM